MIKGKKTRKHRQIRFKSKNQEEKIGKDKFSIQQLLDQSSIEKIEGPDLGRRNSRRDLESQSPQQWIGDTSKQNINILIMTEPKEIDLFDGHFPLQTYITNENQDYNYQLLQMQYDKIVKPIVLNQSSSQQKQQEQLMNRMLNISQIEQGKREQQLFHSRRQSIFQQKIQDFVKIVRRIANKTKIENKILSNSINMSRNSEFKHLINKNLFEINQEWDNLQGTNKGQRIEQDNGFSLKDAYTDAYNDGQLQQQLQQQIQQQLFKGENNRQIQTQRRVDSVNLIKKQWIIYKSRKSKKTNQKQFKPIEINNINIIHHPQSKQQDLNNILNELDESSNNNIGDKSQQLSLEYKQLKMLISNKPSVKVNSNSFCEEKRKKTQGDSLVLEHLGSISAIRSTSKFRQASEHDESEIKEEDDRSSGYYSDVHRFLTRRQIWIKEKSKQNNDENWKRNELNLVSKFRNMLRNPQQPCIPLTKQIATNTISNSNSNSINGFIPIIPIIPQRSLDSKDVRSNKQALKNNRHLISRKTKPAPIRAKERQKQLTYIEDKKLSIILTHEQLKRLMSRQTITNDVDIFNGDEDISVETEQILTQLNFSENQIPPVKSRRIKYNIQLEASFNDSIGKLL